MQTINENVQLHESAFQVFESEFNISKSRFKKQMYDQMDVQIELWCGAMMDKFRRLMMDRVLMVESNQWGDNSETNSIAGKISNSIPNSSSYSILNSIPNSIQKSIPKSISNSVPSSIPNSIDNIPMINPFDVPDSCSNSSTNSRPSSISNSNSIVNSIPLSIFTPISNSIPSLTSPKLVKQEILDEPILAEFPNLIQQTQISLIPDAINTANPTNKVPGFAENQDQLESELDCTCPDCNEIDLPFDDESAIFIKEEGKEVSNPQNYETPNFQLPLCNPARKRTLCTLTFSNDNYEEPHYSDSIPTKSPKPFTGTTTKKNPAPKNNKLNQFVCDFPACGRSYGQASKLIHHQHIHLNFKPHRCLWPRCECSFLNRCTLRKHILEKHDTQRSIVDVNHFMGINRGQTLLEVINFMD